jgi:hypothetical protein
MNMTESGPHKWIYYRIELPGRSSVREPMPPPTMTIVSTTHAEEWDTDRTLCVPLSEHQLLAIITDATATLSAMLKCRGATQPDVVREAS